MGFVKTFTVSDCRKSAGAFICKPLYCIGLQRGDLLLFLQADGIYSPDRGGFKRGLVTAPDPARDAACEEDAAGEEQQYHTI